MIFFKLHALDKCSISKILRINSSASFPVHFTSVVFSGKNIRFSGKTWKYLAGANGAYYHELNIITLDEDKSLSSGDKINFINS